MDSSKQSDAMQKKGAPPLQRGGSAELPDAAGTSPSSWASSSSSPSSWGAAGGGKQQPLPPHMLKWQFLSGRKGGGLKDQVGWSG